MILNISNVSKYYANNIVLDDISYKITKPEIIGLVAPNGSGKSTLFDIITNIKQSDYGQIEVLGRKNTSHKIFNDLSYMQDNSILYPDLTAFDHLKYVAYCHEKSTADIYLITKKLNMDNYIHKKVKNYSLGMKQMLLLAMSIINTPKILLLDEPINGLDVTACEIFRNTIVDLHSKGTTVILSSHNLEEIEKITNHVLFLSEGQLISSNNPELNDSLNNTRTNYHAIVSSAKDTYHLMKDIFQCSVLDTFKLQIALNFDEKNEFIRICNSKEIEIYELRSTINRIHRLYNLIFQSSLDEGVIP